MKRRAIQLICLWGIVVSTTAVAYGVEFAGGTGTANDPYLIATAEQFLGADFGLAGVYYRLSSDIDLSSASLQSARFRAYLDGAGYRILSPTSPTSLFGHIETGATVSNLIVEGAVVGVDGIHAGPTGLWTCGTLAAENDGTISDCGVSGWIASHKDVGGLVLWNRGLIRNCYFNGCVTTDWVPSEYEAPNPCMGAGGLVGRNEGSIRTCYATGVVFARGVAGGLVGGNCGSITDCYAMTIVATDSGGGGLVGVNWGQITHCYAAGGVTGEMRGGLVGMSDLWIGGTVTSCVWDTHITDCPTSGGGIGVIALAGRGGSILMENGWAGEPNWVIVGGGDRARDYPRLIWEGIDGWPVADVPASWLIGGTESDPWVIDSPDQLEYLCKESIRWDKHFVLGKDIDMSSCHEFSPIGVCPGSAFTGSFDGNGHTIRNVTINTEGGTAWNLGVFGYVTGQIKNLTVENIHFTGGQNSYCVGLLGGTCAGLIENCRATGSITLEQDSQYVGGLVGYVKKLSGGTILGCEADAAIEVGEGSTYVGDLVGYEESKR